MTSSYTPAYGEKPDTGGGEQNHQAHPPGEEKHQGDHKQDSTEKQFGIGDMGELFCKQFSYIQG